jgi:opacity protein-like surface antigen
MKKELRGLILTFTAFAAGTVFAADSTPADSSSETLFQKGRYELAFNTGVLFSPALADSGRPTVNYTLTELQFGCMLSDIKEWGWFRGNCEFAAELFGSAIIDGRGTYLAGTTLWLRHNFVQQGWRVVPFVQAGVGLTETDTDRRLIGQAFNFNIDAGAGVHYFITPNWSVNLEYRYQHISNAKLSKTDIGINAHGPMVGVSYLF